MLTEWLAGQADIVFRISDIDELMACRFAAGPRLVAFDARIGARAVYAACRRLKADSYTGVVPVVILTDNAEGASPRRSRRGRTRWCARRSSEPEM